MKALLIATVVAVALLLALPSLRPSGLFRDFDAFYCAGRVTAAGADPYRAEPLGACERAPKPAYAIAGMPGLVMPAPLPPYALAAFRLLAPLPFAPAACLWTLVGVACLAFTAFACVRMTGLPLVPVVAALSLIDGYAAWCLGQVAPIAVAAIALSASALADGCDARAAWLLAPAAIEPHLALPAFASLFVYRAKARLPLLAIAALCIAVALLDAGWSTTLQYVARVLPAHALSEIANEKQLSLTYALHRAGFGDAFALRAGEAWYALACALGIVACGRIARGTSNAAIVAIPPALATFGGPFVHIVQIAAAMPAALLLYSGARRRERVLLGIAVALLAIPWIQFANLGTIFGLFAVVAIGLLVYAFVDRRPLVVALAAAGGFAFYALLVSLVRPIPNAVPVLVAHYDPHALAEASWTLFVRTIGSANATAFDVAKIPTLAALCVVTFVTCRRAFAVPAAANRATGGKEGAPARRTSNA